MDITLTSAEWVTSVSRRTLDRLNGEEGNMIAIEKIRHLLLIADEESDQATDELLQGADSGDLAAQTDLAAMLLQGKNPALAIYWLRKAAKRGHPDAMHMLAGCYLRGEGVSIDRDAGLMWLYAAASADHVIAKEQAESLLLLMRAGLEGAVRQQDRPIPPRGLPRPGGQR